MMKSFAKTSTRKTFPLSKNDFSKNERNEVLSFNITNREKAMKDEEKFENLFQRRRKRRSQEQKDTNRSRNWRFF